MLSEFGYPCLKETVLLKNWSAFKVLRPVNDKAARLAGLQMDAEKVEADHLYVPPFF